MQQPNTLTLFARGGGGGGGTLQQYPSYLHFLFHCMSAVHNECQLPTILVLGSAWEEGGGGGGGGGGGWTS